MNVCIEGFGSSAQEPTLRLVTGRSSELPEGVRSSIEQRTIRVEQRQQTAAAT